jgi:polysaccharide biosynthesis protein PelG
VAGVGFSLRALGSGGNYAGLLRLYGAAGLISSGPWLLSVLTLLAIGTVGRGLVPEPQMIERFQVCITWLFAGSLVFSGPLQLQLTRFIADRSYLGRQEDIAPNLQGALALMSLLAAGTACALFPLFGQERMAFKVLLAVAFVVLNDIWIVVGVLTGQRQHLRVLEAFALGYLVTFLGTVLLARYAELGLLAGFVMGQATLLFRGLALIHSETPARQPAAWSFLERRHLYLDLLLIGFVYNLSIWADKLLFWFNADTSRSVLGPLRGSDVYDLPIFLAYLSIVPGMAVFLVRVETDFAEQHQKFYQAIRDGAALRRLEALREAMTDAARRAVADIVKVQGLTLLACFWFGRRMLELCGISPLHLPLFYVDAVGVGLQVVLLSVTSIFFYLDCRRTVVALTCLLLGLNFLLSWWSQQLGPAYYGFGFATAMALTSVIGLSILGRTFRHLVRDTFMLQPVGAAR